MDRRETRQTRDVRTPGSRNEASLPVWAQQELARLRNRIIGLENDIGLLAGKQVTRISINDYIRADEGKPPIYVDERWGVDFHILDTNGKPDIITATLSTAPGGDDIQSIEIRSRNGYLAVAPYVCNVLHIFSRKD